MNMAIVNSVTELEQLDTNLVSSDPLRFPGYREQLDHVSAESVDTSLVDISGEKLVLIECRFDRHGGTMGTVAGEKIVRAFARATELSVPVVALIATGGARIQEGMLSLIQMARTTDARAAHASAGLLSVGILRSPVTGGVFASWGSQLDIRAARRGATIGFGGPRVVEQVTGMLPPPISHTAESAYSHGHVDALLEHEDDEWPWISAVLGHTNRPLVLNRPGPGTYRSARELSDHNDPWEAVCLVRDRARPSGLDWAAALTESWIELHGTDPVIRAGLARLAGTRLVVIAMDRHAWTGSAARPGPAAYRTAQRAIALAEQLGLPVLTIIDTPGAEPGPAAEACDIGGEIARTLRSMSETTSLTVSICVGEGGSGGAMALAHSDYFMMFGDAVFSIIGPEAAATILARDVRQAPQMSRAMRLQSKDLESMGLVDEVFDARAVGAVEKLRARIARALTEGSPGDRAQRLDKATARHLKSH